MGVAFDEECKWTRDSAGGQLRRFIVTPRKDASQKKEEDPVNMMENQILSLKTAKYLIFLLLPKGRRLPHHIFMGLRRVLVISIQIFSPSPIFTTFPSRIKIYV
jgi:hypothetical protein